jgi:glucosyl-3-phosphoglycerate synthase
MHRQAAEPGYRADTRCEGRTTRRGRHDRRPRRSSTSFHQQDFDPCVLAEARWASETSISVCLPAQNEAPTVGRIVEEIRRDLVERRGLVDGVIVLDDGSTDATARVAREAGA